MLSGEEYDKTGKIHLYLRRKYKPKGRKTHIYNIVEKEHEYGERLGLIKWYGAFRQYVFYPDNDTMWSKSCLEIINKFLKDKNDRHRKKLLKKKRGG